MGAAPVQWMLVGATSCSAVMAGVWAFARARRNAGWVDLAWTLCVGALGVGYALAGSGWAPRRALLAALIGAWSLRLAAHLYARLRREPEDGRYAWMREQRGAGFDRAMFGLFQAQALVAVLLSVAFIAPSAAVEPGFALRDALAVAVWAAALCGEAVADRQLRAWRADPQRRGRVCRSGLWRYSRHPNYFFEWLHWLAYPLLALGLPWGWIGWAAPALLLFLVLRVTGIPPTEQQALRSRGDDYREYQRTTRAFFPGPPRAATAAD